MSSNELEQDYEQLKQHHLKKKTLFKDKDFPNNDYFIYDLGVSPRDLKWKRPGNIVKKPKFFSDGAQRFDVQQGEIGDCWLLAAVANLTLHKEYLEHVVPSGQSFEKGDYAGIFHFRFWQYGKWVDVVIDDRLPTAKGQLVLMHSAENNEFWSALLEKAYAKLHGSYKALVGGHTAEAMEDFTGGLSEHYLVQGESCPANLFSILQTAYHRGSFIGCAINAKATYQQRVALQLKGLFDQHAYSITSVKQVVQINRSEEQQDFEDTIKLIRIRNPWGNEKEWNGPWSDRSAEWASVSSADKKRLGLSIASDGEFWMSFEDFKRYFDDVEVTNLSPDQLEDKISTRRWEEKCFEGQWVSGVSAGGSRKFRDTFFINPQYIVTLNDPDEDDDDDLCTFVVSVMQEYTRKKGLENLKIGFSIYKVKESLAVSQSKPGAQIFDAKFFRKNNLVAESEQVYRRGICERFRLKPGRYCIVPSTYEPHQEREFMIRCFTEKAVKRTRKNGNSLISMTSNMKNLSLYDSIDLADDKEMKESSVEDVTLLGKNSHFWDHFIWSKVEKDDGEYKFVRGELKATRAKANQCQYCKLWFSSTYFFNHFKHCVFDTNRAAEFARAKMRWSQFGESVTEDMHFFFATHPDPVKGSLYRCLAPMCGTWAKDLQTMKEHIWMAHTNEKPYRCTECASVGKIYKYNKWANLDLHIKSLHMPNEA